jgi:photosystem II stability/assembly factor-like uncharacterized protein
MKKTFLSFLVIFFCIYAATAQKIGKSFLPPKTNEMPKWFQIFYESDSYAKFNVKDLDEQFEAYEAEEKKAEEKKEKAAANERSKDLIEPEEILTGEEHENAFANYYKRWRRFIEPYVQEDGSIKIVEKAIITPDNSGQRAVSPTSTWSLLGPIETFFDASNNKAPWQTNVYAIAASPSNPNILYACPETGGIFKTTDKGLNWVCKTMNYNIETGTAIKVHPTNPDTVYMGRYNQLIQSNDGGTTWTIKTMPFGDVHGFVFKPSAPSTVFVATDYGLFRKVKAGTTISQGTPFNVNGLQSDLPKWNRNSGSNATCSSAAGSNQYYRVFPFTVSANGSYTFTACTPSSDWDAHASLFKNAFNGASPCTVAANHIYSDDDANSGGNCNNDPLITATLSTGVTYYLVTTSYNNLSTGGYQWNFTTTSGGTLTSIEESWIQVPNMNTSCQDIFYKTNDENTLFCLKKGTTNMEFWRSTDGGNTFAASISGWPAITSGSGRMTTTIADANRLYVVLLGSTAPADIPHLIRSDDAGLTWTLKCTGTTGLTGNSSSPLGMSNGQGFYDMDILANPNNANDVIVATTTAYKSTDGGGTFTQLGGYGGSFSIHPDIQEMIAVGADTWITTDGGVNYSTDFFTSTANFSPRFKGIFSSDMWGFAQGWNEDIVGGGRYHNGNTAMSENFSAGEAIRLGGGEAPTGYYMIGRPGHIAFSDINPKIIPTTRNGALVDFTFTKTPNEDGYGSDASEIEFFPYCYNHVYSGNGNDLWKSTNGGSTWTSLYTFTGKVRQFEISRSNPQVIYLATNSPTQLQKSTNGGASWTVLTLPAGASANRVSIALSFTDENTLWITSPSNSSGNRVFKSTNGGTSWTNMTTSTIDGQAYENIIHQAGTDNGIYLLGYNGKVFYKSDSETDWVAFSSGMPLIHSNEHVRPFYRDGKLRSAGNHGIWQVDFYEDGQGIPQPTVDKLSTLCARDTFFFEDFSALKHAGATWNWSFPGASYVSSTSARSPKVVYSTPGTYSVSLSVNGGAAKTITNMITVSSGYCDLDTLAKTELDMRAAGNSVVIPKIPALANATSFSVSAWVRPVANQNVFTQILSNWGSNVGFAFGFAFIGYVDNTILTFSGWDVPYWQTTSHTLPIGKWSHVVLTISPTLATIYVDGKAWTRAGTYTNFDLSKTPFEIGGAHPSQGGNFNGMIEELKIYNYALTQDEVRAKRHILPTTKETGIVAHYQFNENAGEIVYDKVNSAHGAFVGSLSRVPSTAPIATGNNQKLSVTTGGSKSFANVGVDLKFPTSGTFPAGDLNISRLNANPDSLPSGFTPLGGRYWVINNNGTNATFTSLTEMKFSGLNITGAANKYKLYKRSSNEHLNNWTLVDVADAAVTGTNGSLTFNTGLTNTSFSQFAILQQGVRLSAKAFLQGPFNTNNNLMDDYHRSANLLPLTEPYTALGYINKESGGEKTTSNVLAQTGNDAIVDWIYIEFRDKNNTANRLYTRAALLQRDGDIVDMDGTSPVYFSTAEVDNYYIAIKHRNHYGIRTTNPIALSSTPVTLNFTNASVPVFGASPLYYVTTNILAMNAGDSNKDGSIDAFDTILWEYQNGLFDDYNYNADYNLDGSVDAFDSILWELNNGKFEELD